MVAGRLFDKVTRSLVVCVCAIAVITLDDVQAQQAERIDVALRFLDDVYVGVRQSGVKAYVGGDLSWKDLWMREFSVRVFGRFGPEKRSDLLATITPRMFREVTGGVRLQLTDARFLLPAPTTPNDRFVETLHWRMTYRPVSRAKLRYIAVFEPFDGRLKSFERYSDIE